MNLDYFVTVSSLQGLLFLVILISNLGWILSCLSQLQTTKFLYGCAVNTFMLKVDWLNNSVAAGSVLPPGK